MSFNYSTIQVSQQARDFAKNIIEWHELKDTGEIAFWLGIPIMSDYIALAIYADRCLESHSANSPYEVVEQLRKEVPIYYFES